MNSWFLFLMNWTLRIHTFYSQGFFRFWFWRKTFLFLFIKNLFIFFFVHFFYSALLLSSSWGSHRSEDQVGEYKWNVKLHYWSSSQLKWLLDLGLMLIVVPCFVSAVIGGFLLFSQSTLSSLLPFIFSSTRVCFVHACWLSLLSVSAH